MVFFYVFAFFMILFFGGWLMYAYKRKKWIKQIKKEIDNKSNNQIVERYYDLREELCKKPFSCRIMIEHSMYSRVCNSLDFDVSSNNRNL